MVGAIHNNISNFDDNCETNTNNFNVDDNCEVDLYRNKKLNRE